MIDFRKHITKIWDFARNNIVEGYGLVAIILFALSFNTPTYDALMRSSRTSVENRVRHLQHILNRHIDRALQDPSGSCLDIENLPEDMVLYKYNLDTLHSWINRFPIVDDYSDSRPYSYRLNSKQPGFGQIAPLAYLKDEWQYVNLGRDWFLVCKRHSERGNVKIIAGIRLKMNPSSPLHYTTLAENPDYVVRGIDGEPLFSLSTDVIAATSKANTVLKWLSFLFILGMLILYHKQRRSWSSFFIASSGLVILRFAILLLSQTSHGPDSLFSPTIYADNSIFPSFGDFLINNLFVSVFVVFLFYIRRDIEQKSQANGKRPIAIMAAALLTLSVATYIFLSLKSLILNSNIVLEPFRINDISVFTLLSYLSFALLILVLLFAIQMLISLLPLKRSISIFDWKTMVIGIAVIAASFVACEGGYGLMKEYNLNRVTTSKLAIERDMPMELFLKSVEDQIAGDRFIATLVTVNGQELIRNRLLDRYLNRFMTDNYDISLSICDNSRDYRCYPFFHGILDAQGLPIEGSEYFNFINNYDGKSSYLGGFPYFDSSTGDVITLFITFEAKQKATPFIAPDSRYSCARYSDGHLTISTGDYNYSSIVPEGYDIGYSMVGKNGYVHFVNKMSDGNLTIISRKPHPAFTYVVSFSYLFIFFALFVTLCSVHYRRDYFLNIPKHSIKRKIRFLVIGPMVVALASLAAALLGFNVNVQEQRDRTSMEDKLSSVQNAISDQCRYSGTFSELCTPEFIASVEQVSRISGAIINIYGVDGSLLYSTSSHPGGRRMHHSAYHEIVHNNSVRTICKEKIAGKTYRSAFAPLYNSLGEMVGIVNVPFNTNRNNTSEAVSSTVATIINLYIVLLITAIIIATILSNSILKPIIELRRKMGDFVLTSKIDRHLEYVDSKDEIGVLVRSYNEMVDALEESSRKLAQNEREAAWKGMARQIAHEIKNPLTPMRLSIQHLIRLKQQGSPDWEEKVESIGKSLLEQIDILAERASEFSSIAKSLGEPESEVNLDELIGEQVTLFDNRDDISLVYDCRVDKPLVQTRRKQLARVFVNLITNSLQAIDNDSKESSDLKEGHIRITVTAETVDGKNWYQMDFEDNGPGVSEENLDKLFQPEFTTKSSGTGLGLSICKSIVEESGGTIKYAPSKNLGGACFTILLPA